MPDEVNSNDHATEVSTTTPRVWKISLGANGTTDLSSEDKAELSNRSCVGIYGDVDDLRVKKFLQIQQGDYFYLCYGNSIQLFGRFTTKEYTHDEGDGWWERPYEKILDAKSNEPFKGSVGGEMKSWLPNFMSTCHRVPEKELSLFEKYILQPYFGITLSQIQA